MSNEEGRGMPSDQELHTRIYKELKRQAEILMKDERLGHTLQPTALLHEAYLRLNESGALDGLDMRAAKWLIVKKMRQVLVDHARANSARKRPSSRTRIELTTSIMVGGVERTPDSLLDLDSALEALARRDRRAAAAVEACYFGGMTQYEVATLLNVDERSVRRDLEFAEAWLHRKMTMGYDG